MRKKIFDFIKKITIPVLLPVFLYVSKSVDLINSSIFTQIPYSFVVISLAACIGIYAYRNAQNKSVFGAIMVVNALLYMVAYSTWRSIIGTPQIEEYLVTKFTLSSNQLSLFKTVFSIGYGAFQFLTGYLIGKFGNKIIGVFGAISACCILLLNSQMISGIEGLMLVRFINGIVVSCGVLSIGHQLRILKVFGHYSVILSSANTFAAVLNAASMYQLSNFVNPHISLNILSGMFLVSSVIFIINGFYKSHADIVSTTSVDKNSTVSYLDVVKTALLTKRYNLMFIQGVLIVIAGWTLRDGLLTEVCEAAKVTDISHTKSQMKYALETGFIYGFLMILYYLKETRHKQLMKYFSFANFTSCLVLMLNNYIPVNIYIIYISIFIIGASVKAHLLPQMIAGSEEKDNKLSAGLVGFLNAGVMLFALPICQQLMPAFNIHSATFIFTIISTICVFISMINK